ncbi:hypothetical protein ACJIZ3_017896 [Penstemon smallii]|uniref:Uncharacterized protein n=1 Tax=Penstemon smallii TaxID=265156 RepID=A0ABD3SWV9_9LAMI
MNPRDNWKQRNQTGGRIFSLVPPKSMKLNSAPWDWWNASCSTSLS